MEVGAAILDAERDAVCCFLGVHQLLVDYLRGELKQCTEVQALGCLLTWHDLPHPYHLANINYSGRPR